MTALEPYYCNDCEHMVKHRLLSAGQHHACPKCGGLMSTFKDIKPRTTKQTRFDWCEA